MKAPERIYIDDPTGEFDDHWSMYPNNDSIEYTCTDAFMKKATNWLMNNTDISSTGIKNFHKAMEGDKIWNV